MVTFTSSPPPQPHTHARACAHIHPPTPPHTHTHTHTHIHTHTHARTHRCFASMETLRFVREGKGARSESPALSPVHTAPSCPASVNANSSQVPPNGHVLASCTQVVHPIHSQTEGARSCTQVVHPIQSQTEGARSCTLSSEQQAQHQRTFSFTSQFIIP